jgi:hypothetical protein
MSQMIKINELFIGNTALGFLGKYLKRFYLSRAVELKVFQITKMHLLR